MRVLYYYWSENSKDDCVEAFEKLGHKVSVWSHEFASYTKDDKFLEDIRIKISTDEADCIFSFNYFPLLSDAAQNAGIPYISWVYDSPHYTLEAKNLNNSCNHVFIFDFALYDRYCAQAVRASSVHATLESVVEQRERTVKVYGLFTVSPVAVKKVSVVVK